jgi:predicted O-linked N-acetylglucosamine transferase (SPINDLY family)
MEKSGSYPNQPTLINPLDEFVGKLPEVEQRRLLEFAKHSAIALVDLQRWVADNYAHYFRLEDISAWYRTEFPTGENAKAINQELLAYDQIDEVAILRKQLAKANDMIDRLSDTIEQYQQGAIDLKQDATEALKLIPKYSQQIQGLADKINKARFIRDTREIALSGADSILRIMASLTKDTSNERFTAELSRLAWDEFVDHLSNEQK